MAAKDVGGAQLGTPNENRRQREGKKFVGFKMLAFPLYTSYRRDIREGYRRTCHWEPSKDLDDCNTIT